MKRIVTLLLIACTLFFTACNDTSVGVIGGAGGPTNIYVKGQFGEQYEKKPIRMINVDGKLYYDTGIGDTNPSCGTLDGNLKKVSEENEIPKKSGGANFDAYGYQHGTSITKEVNIDGEWIIFKKYENQPKDLKDFKYSFYIKGHLNNAAVDGEIIVLSEYEDVTYNDVYEPLLSSQYPSGDVKGKTSHNRINNDKWGLTLYADNVTNKGLTIKFEQFGGNPAGELQTGEWFMLETTIDDEWQAVQTDPLIDYAWNSIAYLIKRNDVTELELDWEWLYGTLPAGFYRLSKEVMDFKAAGDFDKDIYQVYFTIK